MSVTGMGFLGTEIYYGHHMVEIEGGTKYTERLVTFDHLDMTSGMLEGRDQFGENVVTTTAALTEKLHKQLQSARNYSYEATMSDYSLASIKRAKADLDRIKGIFEAVGLDIPEWK